MLWDVTKEFQKVGPTSAVCGSSFLFRRVKTTLWLEVLQKSGFEALQFEYECDLHIVLHSIDLIKSACKYLGKNNPILSAVKFILHGKRMNCHISSLNKC